MEFNFSSLVYILELLGTAVFAVSGALSAGRKGLDILGVLVIAIVTAVGGGTLRDLLLNRHPIFWIADPSILIVIIIAAVFTIVYVRFRKPPLKALLIADAFGLALFTISGTQIAESFYSHPLIIIIMAAITGVAGGIIRDVLSNEVPLILRRDIYATAAIFGSISYLAAKEFGLGQTPAIWIGIAFVLTLRFMAIIWGIRLPVFKLSKDPE